MTEKDELNNKYIDVVYNMLNMSCINLILQVKKY